MPIYKYKRTNKYFAVLNFIDELGNKKSTYSKYFDTKREASEELARMTIEHKKPKSSLTYNDIFNEYLKDQKEKVKPITHSHYEPLYEHIRNLIGNIQVEKLTIPQYKLIKDELNKTKLSTSRKNRIHKLVCTLTNYAYTNHNIINNVPNRAGGFNESAKIQDDIKIFEEDDFKKFRDEFADDEQLYNLFGTLFYEGLRIGEALALNWNDIDLENGYIKINKTYTSKLNNKYKDQKWYITSPKTKASNRTIPIEKSLLNDLKTLYTWYKQFDGFNNDWFVFGGIRPMSETKITDRKNEACNKLGLPQITIHQFRHSCISYLANNDVPPMAIKEFVGHSKLSTTMDIYTHVYKNKVDNIFNFKK